MATKPKTGQDTGDETAGHKAFAMSDLDDKTHAELRMLYAESAEATRFVKNHQWKTVGATLLSFFGMVVIAQMVRADTVMADRLMTITIVLTMAVTFTLIIYQFWMVNELAKLNTIEKSFSSLLRDVRALKSRREGNVHRYTLLVFMIAGVGLGATVVHLALARIAHP